MLKKALCLLILVLWVGSSSLFAQKEKKKEFSKDPKAFLEDLKDFFADDKHPETAEITGRFFEAWAKGGYNPDEQDNIIAQAQFMQQQKLKPYPDFLAYIDMLNTYKDTKVPLEKLEKYNPIAQKIILKQKKDFKNFTNIVQLLFGELAIAKTEAKVWRVGNDQYEFDYTTEPVIIFPKTELQLLTKGDTLGVYTTSGKYYPNTNKWVGNGGFVYWTRVGFSKDRAYAKLKKYTIDTRSSEYRADSAQFSFPKTFAKPIYGRLEDRATTEYKGERASFPRFQSYQSIFQINNVFKDIDYHGGFTLEGAQILGTGTDTEKAVVTIKRNGKPAMRAYSKAFVIDPEKIAALKAAVSIYLDKDSIYHSQIIFSYQNKDRKVSIGRSNIGLYMAPFFDSYHRYQFETGNLIWNLDSPTIVMRTISNPGAASVFESADLYNENKYVAYQGILDYNPLQKLKHIVDVYKKRNFTEDELASEFNNKKEYLTNLFLQMANDGFIFYDIDGGNITVNDKLVHYEMAANKGQDYDIIKFESVISAIPNATINLDNYDFIVQGVPKITVSDSQYTYILPKDQKMAIKKNRDMKFEGQVHSGRFDFYGKDMAFDYAKFNVTLSNLDSVKFKFPEYDKDGKMIGLRTIANTIQNVNGYLYIDEPGNKSGKKPNPDYPIFECNREAYVYYEKPQIYHSVYKKDKFFFKINPFTIKNLDKFTAEGLQFPGSFTSADIMPVIKNALTIQEDFSLGFITQAPEPAGYPLYKGKGIGRGTYLLSNKGLRLNGNIAYLDAKLSSNNFILFPDSMNSTTQQFDIPELAAGKYPPMTGQDVYNHWMPYKDSLYINHGKAPLSVYKGKIDFAGNLVLTPAELVGLGNMKYQNLNISSNSFAFLPKNIKTKSGDVNIKSESGGNRSALKAADINADIDLTKDFGTFKANEDTSKVLLPSNRFSTTLNNFTYDIAKKEVNFAKNNTQSDEDAYFVSNNPEQQELKFKSKKASYNIGQENIKAEDVPFLLIADSKIFTPNKEINIEKEGNIGNMKGAEIVTDEHSENHRIYNATVNVFGQKKFTGFGDYDYVDKNGKKFRIRFSDIRVNENLRTVAKGSILDTSKFYLTPGIRYSGDVSLMSVRKNLFFDGFVFPDHKIPALHSQWVHIADTIDPSQVIPNITEPKGKDGLPLFTGTFVSSDSGKIYNLMFGKKKSAADLEVFTVNGIFYHDDKTDDFMVGPKEKVLPEPGDEQSVITGNIFKVSPSKKELTTEGVYSFGTDFKHIPISTAGTYTYKFPDTTNLFSLVMIADMPMNDDVQKLMTDSLGDAAGILNDVDNLKPEIYDAFANIVKNRKDREKLIGDLSSGGIVTNVDETNKLFVFSELKMVYIDSLRSFVSKGEIGWANSRKFIFNKRIKGTIAITKAKDGDAFGAILQPRNGSYYYFNYKDGTLDYISSDYVFDDKIAATSSKLEKSNKGLKMRLATMREVYRLIRKGRAKK